MYRHIPFTVITIAIGILIAGIVLAIGGTLAGWDIWNMLTSPTAWLIYSILFALAVVALFKYFMSKDSR
jgi:hypothetical protein